MVPFLWSIRVKTIENCRRCPFHNSTEKRWTKSIFSQRSDCGTISHESTQVINCKWLRMVLFLTRSITKKYNNNDFLGVELNILKLFTYRNGYIYWHDIFVLEITKRHLHSHLVIIYLWNIIIIFSEFNWTLLNCENGDIYWFCQALYLFFFSSGILEKETSIVCPCALFKNATHDPQLSFLSFSGNDSSPDSNARLPSFPPKRRRSHHLPWNIR